MEQWKSKDGIWAKEKLSTKNEIKEIAMALNQLGTLQQDLFIACIPECKDTFSNAKEKFNALLQVIVKELGWLINQMAPFHEKFQKVVNCLDSWDFLTVKHLLENSNTENGKKLEKEMESAIECPGLC